MCCLSGVTNQKNDDEIGTKKRLEDLNLSGIQGKY